MDSITIPTRPTRKFLPENLVIDSWEKLEPFYEELKSRSISTKEELKNWLLDRSELEAVLEEDAGWRYIKMTIDTSNKDLSEAYNFFVIMLTRIRHRVTYFILRANIILEL